MSLAYAKFTFISFSGKAKQHFTMPNTPDENVSVSAERFAELEALEKSIPDRVQEAILQYKKDSLKKLHERDKSNPESVKLRMQRYIAKNRDKINERRREKRRKEPLETSTTVANVVNVSLNDMFSMMSTNKIQVNSLLENSDMTVRFDD